MPQGKPYPEYLTDDTIDDRHKSIVECVRKFQRENSCGPTTDEIAKGTGISYYTVREMVMRLEKSGYLIRPQNINRALRVATDDEHKAALSTCWVDRLRSLSSEEFRAVLSASARVQAERIERAGRPPPEEVLP